MAIKAHVIGRLGTDAELVKVNENKFLSFRIATNGRVNRENVTIWIGVSADLDRFRNITQYLTKGKNVMITGTYRDSLYTTKNGQTGIDRKLSADSIEFINIGTKREGEDGNNSNTSNENTETTERPVMTTGSIKQKSTSEVSEDDLPF